VLSAFAPFADAAGVLWGLVGEVVWEC
jgi:hypothetical protein